MASYTFVRLVSSVSGIILNLNWENVIRECNFFVFAVPLRRRDTRYNNIHLEEDVRIGEEHHHRQHYRICWAWKLKRLKWFSNWIKIIHLHLSHTIYLYALSDSPICRRLDAFLGMRFHCLASDLHPISSCRKCLPQFPTSDNFCVFY